MNYAPADDASVAERTSSLARFLPFLPVLAAIGFNLVALRSEVLPAQNLNDSDVHLSMIRWAQHRIETGHVPLDGWFPYFGFGSPHFHHYQSFPHIVSGYIAQIFGAQNTFAWSLYLLLALWPLCIYWSARIFGWNQWRAACAALLSPLVVSLPSIGYEYGSYVWRGFGTWAQLWGMWLLPLALALSWRAISRKRNYVWPAVVLGFTLASHFLTGYLAILVIGSWVLFAGRGVFARFRRATVVVVGALLIASWALIPLFVDRGWQSRNEYVAGTFRADSYGARRVLLWLFSGKLFDDGRLPVLTILMLFGVLICIVRRREDGMRPLLLLGGVSLLLYFGRPTLGPLLKLLPGSGDALFHRYIMGVHLAGIFFAGLTVERAGRTLYERLRRGFAIPAVAVAAAVAVVAAAVLAPAWIERWGYTARGTELITSQQASDATDGRDVVALIDEAKDLGGGRIYAGMRSNWGANYRVGAAPVFSLLANHDADAVGFTLRTASLASDVEPLFDETNPAHYDLFNVKYLILPKDREPAIDAKLIDRRGRHTLWSVKTSGYLELVDTVGSVPGSRDSLGSDMQLFLSSSLVSKRQYPMVAFDGRPAGRSTVSGSLPTTKPGHIEDAVDGPVDGVFGGTVIAKRTSMVLLKASYDPRWRVLIDGKAVIPQMVAPAFVGGVVTAGRHSVLFLYVPFPHYGWLLALGLLSALALAFLPMVPRRKNGELTKEATH